LARYLLHQCLNCHNVEVYVEVYVIASIFSSDVYLDIYMTNDLVANN